MLLTHYYSGGQIENNEVSGACSMYEGVEKRIQGFGGGTLRKEIPWKNQGGWEDNIKIDLQEAGCGGMDWIMWLGTGTCECVKEPSACIKYGEILD